MNYYRRYPGDYARDTGHLSLAEHGAYTLLLDAYYSTGRPLPSSDSQLFKICRANTRFERSAVRSVVEQFWRATEQGLVNDRAEKEIVDQQPRIDAARQNGKRGGRPAGTQRKPSGLADPNPAKSSPAPAPTESKDQSPDGLSSEPSSDPPSNGRGNGRAPPCPYEQIIALYHEHCPDLPRCLKRTASRDRHMAARWRENHDLEYFRAFFQRVQTTPFLLGRGNGAWRADLEWLMKPEKFAKVLEGRYEDKGRPDPDLPEHWT